MKQVINDSKCGRDFTLRLKRFLADGAEKVVPKEHHYNYPPDLRRFVLDEADLTDSSLERTCLSGATAFRAKGSNFSCNGSYMDHSKWGRSELIMSHFDGCRARHAYFSHGDLTGSTFRNSDLCNARFRDATLKSVDFSGSDLRFANLSESRCDRAVFTEAKVFGTSLWGIELDSCVADGLDISPDGDGSILAYDIRLAPLIHLITTNLSAIAELIATIKLRTVVVLGCDSRRDWIRRLERIADVVRHRNLFPILIKRMPEIEGEAFLKKAELYCILAKYVIVENSQPSGHLLELPMALMNGCIIGVMQAKEAGATWLTEELVERYRTARKFTYSGDNDIDQATNEALTWCEERYEQQRKLLPTIYSGLNLKCDQNDH